MKARLDHLKRQNDGTKEEHGVGIVLGPRAVKAYRNAGLRELKLGKRIADDGCRMMDIELKFDNGICDSPHIFFISVYMPTAAAVKSKKLKVQEESEEFGHFYSKEVFGRTSPYDATALDEIQYRDIAYWLGTCPTYDEFIRHVNRAKRNKAAGPNGVKAEMVQLLDDGNLVLAYNFIRKFWTVPDFDMEEWHNVKLAPVPKTTKAKDYRPISLLDILSKILSSLIAERINEHMLKVGLQEQAGFTKGRGCTDTTAALKITLQQLRNAYRDSYVLFLDLVKAFDSVNREMLWKILAKYGLPDSLIVVIRKMYSNTSSGEICARYLDHGRP